MTQDAENVANHLSGCTCITAEDHGLVSRRLDDKYNLDLSLGLGLEKVSFTSLGVTVTVLHELNTLIPRSFAGVAHTVVRLLTIACIMELSTRHTTADIVLSKICTTSATAVE